MFDQVDILWQPVRILLSRYVLKVSQYYKTRKKFWEIGQSVVTLKIWYLGRGEVGRPLGWGLSKNLTAQDIHFSPTRSKYNKTMLSHNSLLSLKPGSKIKVDKAFLSLVLNNPIQKLDVALSWSQISFLPIFFFFSFCQMR